MSSRKLPQLPDEVEFIGDPSAPPWIAEVEDGGQTFREARIRYRVHGFEVTIGWLLDHIMGTFAHPTRVDINFDSFDYAMMLNDETDDARGVFEGITQTVMRAVPLRHAYAVLSGVAEQYHLDELRKKFSPLPRKIESEDDYLFISSAYVAMVQSGVGEPIKRFSEWSGESADTWSARLRRARAMGVLQGTGKQAGITASHQDAHGQLLDELNQRVRRAE